MVFLTRRTAWPFRERNFQGVELCITLTLPAPLSSYGSLLPPGLLSSPPCLFVLNLAQRQKDAPFSLSLWWTNPPSQLRTLLALALLSRSVASWTIYTGVGMWGWERSLILCLPCDSRALAVRGVPLSGTHLFVQPIPCTHLEPPPSLSDFHLKHSSRSGVSCQQHSSCFTGTPFLRLPGIWPWRGLQQGLCAISSRRRDRLDLSLGEMSVLAPSSLIPWALGTVCLLFLLLRYGCPAPAALAAVGFPALLSDLCACGWGITSGAPPAFRGSRGALRWDCRDFSFDFYS